MDTGLVSAGVQNLWDLISLHYERFKGVDDQVTELKIHLKCLKAFLKDADAKKHTSAVMRNCVEEIMEIVYDAEDIIETYVINEVLGKTSGLRKYMGRLAVTISDHKKLASDIGGISKRISKVTHHMQNFGVQQIVTDGEYTVQRQYDIYKETRQTPFKDFESKLVGLEENVKKLVGYLVEEDDIQVVSITGMAGLGKTTLARQVFNHEMVKHRFDGLAWVRVSEGFSRKYLWQTILLNLSPKDDEDNILQMTEQALQATLFRLLETSKTLIVLDNIWQNKDWDHLKAIFPMKKGWKVLLTSRNGGLVICGDPTYINFNQKCLTIEDSWRLFRSIAFRREEAFDIEVDEEKQEMGKQMIDHCCGLPMAVIVLGGLLAAKNTLNDWKKVYENFRAHILESRNFNDGHIKVYHVLSMSFEELPVHLKNCFLYLAFFPEDFAIDVERLSYYWAAEGIFEHWPYNGETIRDVGDGYIEELVRRNMVIAERDVITSKFETCHLHDMMREICLFKAKEENFLQIAGIRSPTANSQSPGTSRRFVSQNPTTLHVERDISNPKLRSLVTIWIDRPRSWMLSGLSFTRLLLLRLLDLSGAEFEGKRLPSSIGKLIHLRYLSLKGAIVSHLPSSLRNLKLLNYLNLGVAWGSIFVPNVFMGMKDLRYLELPMEMLAVTKLELSKLVHLETLKNFSTKKSSIRDLHGMSRLRNLTILFSNGTSLETLSASMSQMIHLENLIIRQDRGSERMIQEGILLDFIHLKVLTLIIYMPRFLKEEYFPSRLTSLSLSQCCLEEDPMPILKKLPHLKEVSLLNQSFSGRKMVCSRGGFPKLQELSIQRLTELEEWIVEEGSLPLLHSLSIEYCKKLKELPDGLRFIYSLKDLTVGQKWKEELSEGGEDYYKVQHIPSVRFGRKAYDS